MTNDLNMEVHYISEDDVKQIIMSYASNVNQEVNLHNYSVHNASSYMLGFLCDYWKLKVVVSTKNEERRLLSFFIKAVSRSNEAKADMVKDMKLFEKELVFYTVIKNGMEVPGLKPWSANLVAALENTMVFQDLNAMQYKMRNKFERFDRAHTLQALNTLARFHSAAIIFEENMSTELQRKIRIHQEYDQFLGKGGYRFTDPWFIQCMNSALEAVRTLSKYSNNSEFMMKIENQWLNVWSSALHLSNVSSEHRNVLCHRDLWNNNILFHYKDVGDTFEPDDCVMVDFQAVRCQPPAGDVMLLLYCNLDPKFREENMDMFLNYYHRELATILCSYGISDNDIPSKEQFLLSAKEQRLWGLVVCACLIPQFWIEENILTNIFSNTAQFDEILLKDKATFIKKMMHSNQNYKKHVMEIFEEIVERYCI